uniref:Uncharacterized protein n=1 Tax=Eutreptiella gymnastica TaxID=73025 RepID=A0A7S1JDQ9_9EUGL
MTQKRAEGKEEGTHQAQSQAEQLAALEEELAAATSERGWLAAQLTAAGAAAQELKAEVVELERRSHQLVNLRAGIVELEGALQQKGIEAEEKAALLEAEVAQAQRQGEQDAEQLSQLQHEADATQGRLEREKEMNEGLVLKLARMTDTVKDLQTRLEDREGEVSRLAQQLHATTKKADALAAQVAELEGQNNTLTAQAAEKDEQHQRLLDSLDQLEATAKEQIEALAQEMAQKDAEKERLQANLHELERSLREKQDELQEVSSGLGQLQDSLQSDDERISQLEASLAQKEKQLKKKEQDLEAVKVERAKISAAEVRALKEALAAKQQQLDTAMNDCRSLAQSLDLAVKANDALQLKIEELQIDIHEISTSNRTSLLQHYETRALAIQTLREENKQIKEREGLKLRKLKQDYCRLVLRRALAKLTIDRSHHDQMWTMLHNAIKHRDKQETTRAVGEYLARKDKLEVMEQKGQSEFQDALAKKLQRRKQSKQRANVLQATECEALQKWKKVVFGLIDTSSQRRKFSDALNISLQKKASAKMIVQDFEAEQASRTQHLTKERWQQQQAVDTKLGSKRKLRQFSELVHSPELLQNIEEQTLVRKESDRSLKAQLDSARSEVSASETDDSGIGDELTCTTSSRSFLPYTQSGLTRAYTSYTDVDMESEFGSLRCGAKKNPEFRRLQARIARRSKQAQVELEQSQHHKHHHHGNHHHRHGHHGHSDHMSSHSGTHQSHERLIQRPPNLDPPKDVDLAETVVATAF